MNEPMVVTAVPKEIVEFISKQVSLACACHEIGGAMPRNYF